MTDLSELFRQPFAGPSADDVADMVAAMRVPRNPLIDLAESNHASEFHTRLMKWIKDFDHSLDEQSEVGIRLVSFGQTIVFSLEDIGYWNPSLIVFSGHTQDGQPVELIQHVTQISILLMKLPRQNLSEPKRPFGFHSRAKSDSE